MDEIFLEKEVCTYTVSKADLSAAQKAIILLIEHIQKINNLNFTEDYMYISLHSAVVIYYARSFKKSNPNISLKKNDIAAFISKAESELHDDIIDMRDSCIAHSDRDVRATVIYPPGTCGNNKDFLFQVKNRVFEPTKIIEILALIDNVMKIVDELYLGKIEKLCELKGYATKPYKLKI